MSWEDDNCCCLTAVEEYHKEREHIEARLRGKPSARHQEYTAWLQRHKWLILNVPAWEAGWGTKLAASLQTFYLPAVREQLNQPSPLLHHLALHEERCP